MHCLKRKDEYSYDECVLEDELGNLRGDKGEFGLHATLLKCMHSLEN